MVLRPLHDWTGSMLASITEADWEIALEFFPCYLMRRDDDRRFLEALHFFTVQNVTWRALPAVWVTGIPFGRGSPG